MSLFRVFSLVARLGAVFMFCAAGAAFAQEPESKAGKFEAEIGGLLINLSESANTPSITNRNFVATLSLRAGMEIDPVNTARATLDIPVLFRATVIFAGSAVLTMNDNVLTIRSGNTLTLFQNNMRFTVTANVMASVVALNNASDRAAVASVSVGETLSRLGMTVTVDDASVALTVLPNDVVYGRFTGGNLRGCAAETDTVGGVGASGRFYLVDDFVDVSLESGFYATVQKGQMRLNCRLEGVSFGGIPDSQTARAVKSGEWSANSIFMGLRIEDEFGPALAYFRVGGNYWTREYDLPTDFDVDGLRYKADANGREYYVPAPVFRWRAGEGFLSESKQDGFSSHFAFGVRFGRLSAGWTRNKQDDFRVDAYQFSYNHEF